MLAIDLLKALKLLGTASDVYISSSAFMYEEQENTSPTNNATIRNNRKVKDVVERRSIKADLEGTKK